MANAIIALTRGYRDRKRYSQIINRTISIKQHIRGEYDLILFHEGNISEEDQTVIITKSGTQIKFVDISQSWKGGYEGMCRFMIYDIWQYCSEYEYVMRIDEDCIIKSCDFDPFEVCKGKDYLTSVWWGESHSETNATLPAFIQELTGAEPSTFYNNRFPYTNVSLAKVSFMQGLKELKTISESPLQKANRWGDLPVIGALLNIYGTEVSTLKGLSYHHASHNMNIECK